MTSEEMKDLIKRKPFQPFRVHLHDGRHYDVVNPEFNLVSRTKVLIGFPEPNGKHPYADDGEYVDLDLIKNVEMLSSPTASGPSKTQSGDTTMTADELRELVKRQPYVPVRLHLKNGETFDILFPELTLITTREVSVGWKDPHEKRRIARDSVLIGMDYIDRYEFVPAAEAAHQGK